ncbi:hypothetical protein HMPREF9193_01246 [Treponema lecithinolyticum ATCC 700332]|uniref:Uncharacterized protein n=1 Tax=Treponema lecithinolyticum ATCC 700332 TaxID=1321815 RepID=A0ABN0NYG1_TRELE|nr:hypothetical protein HMPREF9193_01246 [Treponema lecithinolyticum ATCC 700332]
MRGGAAQKNLVKLHFHQIFFTIKKDFSCKYFKPVLFYSRFKNIV